MKKILLFIFVSLYLSANAQDSIQKVKLKLFDCNSYVGMAMFKSKPYSIDYALQYNDREDVKAEMRGYTPGDDYTTSTQKGFGLEYVTNMSFSITGTKHQFFKRIKPRISLYVYQANMIDRFYLVYSNEVLDTFPPNASNPTESYLDSATYGKINYSYSSNQVMATVGTNVDVFVRKAIIVYTGIIFGAGTSYKNKVVMDKYEWQNVYHTPVPSGYDGSKDLVYFSRSYTQKRRSSTLRASIPIGIEFRFRSKRPYTMGMFLELRPSIENFHIQNGLSFTRFILPFGFGVRYCFGLNK